MHLNKFKKNSQKFHNKVILLFRWIPELFGDSIFWVVPKFTIVHFELNWHNNGNGNDNVTLKKTF